MHEAIEYRGFVETPVGDIETADGCLEDSPADHLALETKVKTAETEPTRWNRAYAYLANGADVFPPIDTRSGCRGPRLELYRKLAGNRD